MRTAHRLGCRRWTRAACGALAATAIWGALEASADAQSSGVVFVDADADGVRDADEPGRPGVVVSNGRTATTTDADGHYALRAGPDGFAFVVRPDDFDAGTWYRAGGGDFALAPAPFPDAFFFVQISDAHAYPDAADYERYSQFPLPWWMPRFVGSWLVLRFMDDYYADETQEDIVEAFRRELLPYRDVADAWGPTVLSEYSDEFVTPGSPLGDVDAAIRAAVAEVAALGPAFVVSTGDLLLESNTAPRDVVERWFAYYDDLTRATGIPFYDTIGNNEIAGILNDDFAPEDPGYGKGVWKTVKGPTHYSFDRGRFHFVALDTHRAAPTEDDPKRWDFGGMSDDVRAWLEDDLERHGDRVVVVLNHEPFHREDDWGSYEPADDDGLFAELSVPYVLAGHIHKNGFEERDGTTHITTAALSGTRWIVPRALQPRGYRVFWAQDDRLYSAWKELDAPLLGFVEPRGDDAIAPASKDAADPQALRAPVDVVAVAVDAKGPFASVELALDGESLPLERWGRYFVHARLSEVGGAGTLTLRATDAAGAAREVALPIAPAR